MLEIVLLSALLINLMWLLTFHLKIRQALQWWFQRQSIQLANEAEKIRDDLLQESFSIRRSLERSLTDSDQLSIEKSQDWLEQIADFHHALEQLSDRLSPPHVEYSLPLATQWLIERWQTGDPRLTIEMTLPTHWNELPECSQIVLRILDELLQITSSELSTKLSIQVSLKQQENISELIYYISFPNVSTLRTFSQLKELKYLSRTFRFLMSGQCFWRRQELTGTWYFRWRSSN